MPIDIGLSSFQIDGVKYEKLQLLVQVSSVQRLPTTYQKKKDAEVTVFDHGLGQATKAAAGIISPWFPSVVIKAWYRMARLGSRFLPRFSFRS